MTTLVITKNWDQYNGKFSIDTYLECLCFLIMITISLSTHNNLLISSQWSQRGERECVYVCVGVRVHKSIYHGRKP